MPTLLEVAGPIAPPFDFNHPDISKHSPEVTGRLLLKSMCERLGWPSLSGKRLLDLGCGVRFARTIFNLEMEIALYCGVEANPAPIAWLKEHLTDPQLRFEHFDMHNRMYNPQGRDIRSAAALQALGLGDFDAACMFSVITHQPPDQTELIFAMLRRCAKRLYFTAGSRPIRRRAFVIWPSRPAGTWMRCTRRRTSNKLLLCAAPFSRRCDVLAQAYVLDRTRFRNPRGLSVIRNRSHRGSMAKASVSARNLSTASIGPGPYS